MATPAKRLFRPPMRPTRQPDWATSRPTYRPRRPTATPLYPVVQHHIETFLTQAAESDPLAYGVPVWVERDFRAYLRCGILAYGFARARCGDCGHERLIAFSCRGRGVCPSCNARRMAEVGAYLTDHVLPHLPLRQWVLSLPKRLRPRLHRDPEVAGAVLRVFVRALRSALCGASPGAPLDAQLAAVSFPQRFGGSLNPHYHFHVLALDGVFSQPDPADPADELRFHEATLLTPEHWSELERTVQRRVLRAFRRRGLLEEDAAADMLTWQGSGGFSVDASVCVDGEDRAAVERLVRYCARGPLALERLHALDGQASLDSAQARLLYRLPEPDLQGRTALILSPLELLEHLSRLIPPPRIHRHRYHGVLAPHARLRAAVVAIGRAKPDEAGPDQAAGASLTRAPLASPALPSLPAPPEERPPSAARIRWVQLLARIHEVLPLLCPACGGPMSILAFFTDPPTVRAILLHLALPDRPPPVAPARGPPQVQFDFDQSTGFDPTEGDSGLDFDFDQSLPDDLDD